MDSKPLEATAQAKDLKDAAADYSPLPPAERKGIALCLSGGGYRASLFHLGALRRLDELGVIGRLSAVSAVSGGSIAAAHLAAKLAERNKDTALPSGRALFPDWEKEIAVPFRALTRRDLRTGPLLAQLEPWNWFRPDTAVRELTELYERYLTNLRMVQLPPIPCFIFCATDMVFGVNWVFERTRLGDWQAGYVDPTPESWSLAQAVAASSCFPPLFPPFKLGISADRFDRGAYRGKDRTSLLQSMRLTDGGVYDNLGLEAVWKNHATILVSDGGGRLDFTSSFRPDRTLLRYTTIVQNQEVALRKRWLIASLQNQMLKGTYWGVGSSTSRYGPDSPPGYSKQLASTTIAGIRTDLNAFTEGEVAVLENHGYLLAEAALRRHAPDLYGSGGPPPSVPHPEWMEEARVSAALAESSKRFSWRRWLGHQ